MSKYTGNIIPDTAWHCTLAESENISASEKFRAIFEGGKGAK